MATQKKDGLLGSNTHYSVNEEAKRYTLKDNGFMETKNGSFQYERTLSIHAVDKKAPKLKIVISKDLSELKLSAVTANGLKKIDLYKSDQLSDERTFAENILKSLVEGKVLTVVD
ncbi:hypothetical protein [Alkalibacterium pelagium]|uniref:Putative amino acid metabolism n=1 Tax=Alkalibacterium pelagium TaxID=426702 RepID=A0A1H7GR89_9LACT|nr:hypothetical protein [Alkalibacterium pelagium]GEN49735.1 cysteine desulfurase [Alkalibacterium pelagium]SEK40027.1 Putative amino acid metabolism [Alkalibacterium pelagium]